MIAIGYCSYAQHCHTEDTVGVYETESVTCLTLADYAPSPQDDTIIVGLTWVITKNSAGQSYWNSTYAQDKADIE